MDVCREIEWVYPVRMRPPDLGRCWGNEWVLRSAKDFVYWVKKVRIFSKPDKQVKQPEKLHKLSFLVSEMVLKSAILGQTKGQKSQTKCSFKKRRSHSK